MSGFLSSPTWNPPKPPISLGTTGQVLTMVGGSPAFANASGGGGSLGSYLAAAPATGTYNNYNPAGFGTSVGRLDISTTSGNVTLTGLAAGTDGQLLNLRNTGANNLILRQLNAGSSGANQFAIPADNYTLTQYGSIFLCYYGGSVNQWCQA